MNRTIWILVVLTTMFSLGHHVDHALRHHAGWPVENRVTPFTLALGIYVAIAIGTVLSRRGIVGPGFWSILAAIGVAFITLTHFGPFAEDPPARFASEYGSQTKGMMSLIWLCGFEITLAVAMIYSGYRWMLLRRRTLAPEVAR